VREALSARLDGERQHVLAQRVDAHLESCRDCGWLIGAAVQTRRVASVQVGRGPNLAEKIMATAGVASIAPYRPWPCGLVSRYRRWALTDCCGCGPGGGGANRWNRFRYGVQLWAWGDDRGAFAARVHRVGCSPTLNATN
jgi:Putative zinc-finger